MNVNLIKKQIFIVILLFLFVILNGCLSNDKEIIQTQLQAYNDEKAFSQNALKTIYKNYTEIGEDETVESASAVKELEIQFKLIEERYTSSDFDEILPCKDAENFIKFQLDAVRLGKSAVENISKYYNQDSASPDWSSSDWYSYISDISNVYSNFTYSSKRLESIRSTLEKGEPIK